MSGADGLVRVFKVDEAQWFYFLFIYLSFIYLSFINIESSWWKNKCKASIKQIKLYKKVHLIKVSFLKLNHFHLSWLLIYLFFLILIIRLKIICSPCRNWDWSCVIILRDGWSRKCPFTQGAFYIWLIFDPFNKAYWMKFMLTVNFNHFLIKFQLLQTKTAFCWKLYLHIATEFILFFMFSLVFVNLQIVIFLKLFHFHF